MLFERVILLFFFLFFLKKKEPKTIRHFRNQFKQKNSKLWLIPIFEHVFVLSGFDGISLFCLFSFCNLGYLQALLAFQPTPPYGFKK